MSALFTRYRSNKSSILTINSEIHSKSLKELSYIYKRQNKDEKQIEPATENSLSNEEKAPIDEVDGMQFIPSIQFLLNKKIHHEFTDRPVLPPISSAFNLLTDAFLKNRIEVCNLICDFVDPEADLETKKLKTQALNEIINLTDSKEDIRKIGDLGSLFSMIEKNIFRTLPVIPKKYMIYDEELLFTEITWSHLSLVYTILLQIQAVYPTDSHFSRDFVEKILNNCSSCDLNERNQVLQFLINHTNANTYDIRVIMDYFYKMCIKYIYQGGYSFCVTPALQYFIKFMNSSYIGDFSYVSRIFNLSILPLMKCQHLATFMPMLDPIFNFMISKDYNYSVMILDYIIYHWPVAFHTKQILFLRSLNLVLRTFSLNTFSQVAKRVFKLYAECLESKSHKVVEESLKVWRDSKVIPLIIDNTRIIFSIIIDPLIKVMKYHWSSSTKQAAMSTYKQMHDLDPFVFDEVCKKMPRSNKDQAPNQLFRNWTTIAKVAARNDKNINLARILSNMQTTFVSQKETNRRDSNSVRQKSKHRL